MKNVFFILILVSLISCGNSSLKKNHSIIGMESKSRNFKEINQLKNYIKVIDTTIFEDNIDPKYGILHLKNESNHLIIFKGIATDSAENVTYKILDTLSISNLEKAEFITIGYCFLNNDNDENIIAIVEKTDSLKIQNIKKFWRANTTSEKIELSTNLNGINCFNEK